MADIDADPDPQLTMHLVAGRRAALGAMVAMLPPGAPPYNGPLPEDLPPRDCSVNVNGWDIGPAIDAAVMETIVRLQHPDATPRQRRAWWRFWR